jgi:hypothetical protein
MMDLLDFDAGPLYFDDPMPPGVDALLRRAADSYAEGESEPLLLRAYFLAPQHLTVLVGLYRYYYYQHRLDDARVVAQRALAAAAERLAFPADWHLLDADHLGRGIQRSMGLVRFYLMALKAHAFLQLRTGDVGGGCAMLEKLAELDTLDRIGGRALLAVARTARDEAWSPALATG